MSTITDSVSPVDIRLVISFSMSWQSPGINLSANFGLDGGMYSGAMQSKKALKLGDFVNAT
jgi:hypothetical protein